MRICQSCKLIEVATDARRAVCQACKTARLKAKVLRYNSSPLAREARRKYKKSLKGKAARRKYRISERGMAAYAKYRQSPRGREIARRYYHTAVGKMVDARKKAMRRAQLKREDATLTATEWADILAKFQHRCRYCEEKLRLTMDHVIPLSKGGKHTADNVVPSCQPCNSRKYNHILAAA